MKDLVAMLGEALELQARARARLRLTPAALHAARRTRTARAPQEIKYVNPANEIGDKARTDYARWQQQFKKMTPPKSRCMWRPAAQGRRPNSPPPHAPASARPS